VVLTAHWMSVEMPTGSLTLKTALIGFHPLKKRYTGVNIARTILHLLDRARLTHKVCLSQIYMYPLRLSIFR
jgi:hypothetical protein